MVEDTYSDLPARLQKISARLNALRSFPEPRPSSRVPVLGLLINLLRWLANRLATRWYVAPQMEQQARFAQEVTAAYDQVASILVRFDQILAEHSRRLDEQRREIADLKAAAFATVPLLAGPLVDWETLLSLPDEALHAWENADLPPVPEESGTEMEPAKWYDRENALIFPMLWADPLTGWHYLFQLAVLGPALNCRPGDLVLDLAGGSGWVSEFLSRFGLRAVLLDLVEDLLHTSRIRFGLDRRLEKCPIHHPVVGDALHLPFAEATFDGVICMNALHHFASYEAALQEIFRVLKPGGRAVFGEPGEEHACTPASRWARREYGVVEKNLPLPLIYAYARRVGFSRMWRYPFPHPEALELPYPEEAGSMATILQRVTQVLPDWLRTISLFALEKEGRRHPSSNLSPLEQARCRLQAEITLLEYREQVAPNEPFMERVRVRNTGDVIWLAGPRPYGGSVYLGVKLCDFGGRLLRTDLAHVALPRDIAPGEEIELNVPLQAPEVAGRYILKYDLAGRTWFEPFGSKPAEHPLQVLSPGDAASFGHNDLVCQP